MDILRISKTRESQQFSCLGEQLEDILSVINEDSKPLLWYGLDVDYYEITNGIFNTPISRFIHTKDLIIATRNVEQFLSGVFIASENDITKWDLQNLPKTEEDEGFQIDEAEIEIRAFDTTYYEVYLKNSIVAEKLKLAFHPYIS
ncbi:hypothetical protein H8B09_15760 [Paenibacillus sp. PR3]|uniref:AraC family transcriptional regulator n=1 Tax=Paenibacillus terricola TaxID=2763503 RepID=A0ABR8MW84_9BACL|nr:hypothetical protein [Paenibacillus terricola]MBD3920222.1 hypothetical protein [Paenibacillus terricola]